MKRLFFTILGMMLIMLSASAIWAQTTITGDSDPFTFDTTSAAIPLSGLAMGVTLLLIILFLTLRHIWSRKKAGI